MDEKIIDYIIQKAKNKLNHKINHIPEMIFSELQDLTNNEVIEAIKEYDPYCLD